MTWGEFKRKVSAEIGDGQAVWQIEYYDDPTVMVTVDGRTREVEIYGVACDSR